MSLLRQVATGMRTSPARIERFIPLNRREGADMAFPDRIDSFVEIKKAPDKRSRRRYSAPLPNEYNIKRTTGESRGFCADGGRMRAERLRQRAKQPERGTILAASVPCIRPRPAWNPAALDDAAGRPRLDISTVVRPPWVPASACR